MFRRSSLLALLALLSSLGCKKEKPEAPPASVSAPAVSAALPLAPTPSGMASASAPSGVGAAASASGATLTSDVLTTARGPLRIVPVFHGMLRLELEGVVVYVDPHRVEKIPDAPRADLVLITDIHADHYDPKGLDKVWQPTTKVLAPPVVVEKEPRATAIKNGGTTKVLDLTVDAVPMYNLKRGPKPGALFHDKGRGNGYVVTVGERRVYIAGDTECTAEMRALKNIDVAFVPMNLPYTMPPEEAAECVRAFRPRVVYPYHYRGSDLTVFQTALAGLPEVEVRVREWYPGGA